MNDTVLIIPAWHRPDYLERALASWAIVPGAETLRRVVIALGRGYEGNMRDIILGCPVPCACVVQRDSDRAAGVHGPHAAIGEAIAAAFTADPGCRFVIVSDEDVIVSDDTLAYFAWARQFGGPLVCAHNNIGQGWSPQWDDADADQDAVRLLPEFTGWTWGVTRQAWDAVIGPEWDWDESSGPNSSEHGFDWQCHRIAVRDRLRVAVPDASRCQNIGRDGGVYAIPAKFAGTQAASFREKRGNVAYRLVGGFSEEGSSHQQGVRIGLDHSHGGR